MEQLTILQWLAMTAGALGAAAYITYQYLKHRAPGEKFNLSKALAALIAAGPLIIGAAKATQLPGPEVQWGTFALLSTLYGCAAAGWTSAMVGNFAKKKWWDFFGKTIIIDEAEER